MEEETSMSLPLELLTYRLIQRGFSPDHIPKLMRDVIRIVGEGGVFTTKLVNVRLGQLGWGCELLDETSFQLSVHFLESEWGYRVRHYASTSPETID